MTVANADMCRYCFDVLRAGLAKQPPPPPPQAIPDEPYALFVTWKKWSPPHHEYILRGCIGTFQPHALRQGLAEYAITSALHDRRFSPVTMEELPQLQCGVSLLTTFEPASNYLDWKVGTHGIWIEFELERGRVVTATYLPEVMPEQGWDKLEAIDSLLRKGGYKAAITDAKRQSIRLTRYRSEKVAMDYKQWQGG